MNCFKTLVLVIAVCGIGEFYFAAVSQAVQEREFRYATASSANRGRAIELIDVADQLRAEWETLSLQERRSAAGEAQRQGIENCCNEIICLAPGTELAAIAMRNIMGSYTAARDLIRTKAMYRRIISEYPGTMEEISVNMHMGLTYLQSVHNPEKALPYFEKIRNPKKEDYTLISPGGKLKNNDPNRLSREAYSYINSRLQMVRCHYGLNQLNDAVNEIAALKAEYPEAEEWINREAEAFRIEHFGLDASLEGVADIADDILSEVKIEKDILDDITLTKKDTPKENNETNQTAKRENTPVNSSEAQQVSLQNNSLNASNRVQFTGPELLGKDQDSQSSAIWFFLALSCFALAGGLEYLRRRQLKLHSLKLNR